MKGRNMTRWRDPAKDPRQEAKSNLITAEGAARLRGILDHLSRVKRPALSAKVGEAAALGDRSENADYTYNKKRSEEHTSELQSRPHLVCRLLLEKKKATTVTQ